ncbi:Glycosyltransferase family 2 [human gut metagenome]|uniref:Glycosyltransferase family 2 n=1 Tax=human gut metagenome TaxID=408170 RepID=W1WPT9_9ZZZZ
MKPFLSIIIPVYNAENYLNECIEALLNQKFKDCEFIFINDGSTDKSINIIKEYISRDSRIKLLNQKNKGVSEARNIGILNSSGRYITFVDADDCIDKYIYEKVNQFLSKNNWDVLIYNIEEEIDGIKNIIKYDFPSEKTFEEEYIKENIIPIFIREDKLNSVCNKVYKKSFISSYKIKFPKGVALGEDCIFNINVFNQISTCGYLNYTGYYYRETKNSATRNINFNSDIKRALDIYKLDYNKIYNIKMEKEKLKKLKSIRLINTIKAYIYIIFKNNYNRKTTKNYVKKILYNDNIQKALKVYKQNVRINSRYEKVMIYSIERKLYFLLYMICKYSIKRNSL